MLMLPWCITLLLIASSSVMAESDGDPEGDADGDGDSQYYYSFYVPSSASNRRSISIPRHWAQSAAVSTIPATLRSSSAASAANVYSNVGRRVSRTAPASAYYAYTRPSYRVASSSSLDPMMTSASSFRPKVWYKSRVQLFHEPLSERWGKGRPPPLELQRNAPITTSLDSPPALIPLTAFRRGFSSLSYECAWAMERGQGT